MVRSYVTAPVIEVEPDPEEYPGETIQRPKGVDAADVEWVAWYPPDPTGKRCAVLLIGSPVEVDAVLGKKNVREPASSLVRDVLEQLVATEIGDPDVFAEENGPPVGA